MSLIRTATGYRKAQEQLEANRTLRDTETKALIARGATSDHAERVLRALHMRIADLESEIETYEAFARGDLSGLERQPLGIALIAARIARGMSQADLARHTGLDSAQINRHEVNEYRSAGIPHIELVRKALALDATFHLVGGQSAEDPVHLEQPAVTIPSAVFHAIGTGGPAARSRS